MKIVIQCAASKNPAAGCWQNSEGRHIMFVAHPGEGLPEFNGAYAVPDSSSDQGASWRSQLLQYNAHPSGNPFNLYPAHKLYQNGAYQALVDRFGVEQVFILSAGWGLIRADFLTPQYDITFSASAEVYKRRKKTDCYSDICELAETESDPIVFLGGKDYRPLFCRLTRHIKAVKTIFYNSGTVPQAPGFELIRYPTATCTNWHYECAKALVSGSVKIAQDRRGGY
jgi:hypothetical protein